MTDGAGMFQGICWNDKNWKYVPQCAFGQWTNNISWFMKFYWFIFLITRTFLIASDLARVTGIKITQVCDMAEINLKTNIHFGELSSGNLSRHPQNSGGQLPLSSELQKPRVWNEIALSPSLLSDGQQCSFQEAWETILKIVVDSIKNERTEQP